MALRPHGDLSSIRVSKVPLGGLCTLVESLCWHPMALGPQGALYDSIEPYGQGWGSHMVAKVPS